jgi:hypothetical protein
MTKFKPWGTGGDAAEKTVKSLPPYTIHTSFSYGFIIKHDRFGFVGYCESVEEGEAVIQRIKESGRYRL